MTRSILTGYILQASSNGKSNSQLTLPFFRLYQHLGPASNGLKLVLSDPNFWPDKIRSKTPSMSGRLINRSRKKLGPTLQKVAMRA